MGSPAEVFLQIVEALQFFEFKEYHGISVSDFEKIRCHINLHTQIARNEVQQSYQEKSINGINKKIEDYFDFNSYSEECFVELFSRIIKQQKSKAYLIDEAISISKSAPDATYIVLFKNGEEVCAVTKTAHLLSHIEKKHKQYDANSVAFDLVDSEYADDLLIALLDHFSLLPPKIQLTAQNRKYTDLNSAVFVYQRSRSISKKQVLFAIENTPIRTIETVSGQIVLDKVKLHKALFCQE